MSENKSNLELRETHEKRRRRSRALAVTGVAMMVLGAIFVIFAVAPALVPGGVPTGPLEFGGKGWNAINGLELLLGGLIIVVGALIWKFAHRHVAILAAGVIIVFVMSAFAVLSSLNSNLTLTSININFQYGASDQGYFWSAQQVLPVISRTNQSNQILTIDEGSSFNITFSLQESSQASGNDDIVSIKATTALPSFSFQVTSVDPSLPIAFSPGRSNQIKLNLVAPFYSTGQSCPPQYCLHGSYNGPIILLITTTNR